MKQKILNIILLITAILMAALEIWISSKIYLDDFSIIVRILYYLPALLVFILAVSLFISKKENKLTKKGPTIIILGFYVPIAITLLYALSCALWITGCGESPGALVMALLLVIVGLIAILIGMVLTLRGIITDPNETN